MNQADQTDRPPEYRTLVADRMTWTVRSDMTHLFDGPRAVNWSRLADEPGCRVVKSGPHRSVVYLERAGQSGRPSTGLYVKMHHYPRLTDQLHYLLRRSRVEREWHMLLEARARGVSCVPPVAMGERRRGGFIAENYLVTEAVTDGVGLKELVTRGLRTFRPEARDGLLRRLGEQFGRFCARLHQAGIYQRDFHAGNILVTVVPAGFEFTLLDLHAAQVRGSLGLGACIDNLVSLNGDLSPVVPAGVRMRFFAAYVAGHEFLRGRFAQYCRLIEERSQRARRRGLPQRDRRCLKNNRRFRSVRRRGLVGHTVRDMIELPEKVLDVIPSPGMSQPHARVVKHSRTSTVWEQTLDLVGLRLTIFVKRYNRKKALAPVRDLFRGSRAMRGWRVGHALRNRRVPAARPLAAMERRRLGLPVESLLVTEAVTDSETLTVVVAEGLRGPAGSRKRRRLTEALAGWVRRLHREGFTARDLKPNNLLVRDIDGAPEIVLVDFDGVSQVHVPSGRQRVRDIARLAQAFVGEPAVRDVDRMRFLVRYLGPDGRDKRVRRRWWGLISHKGVARRAT